MARILLSMYSFIVFISFVQGLNATTSVTPSPATTSPGSNLTSTTNGAPGTNTAAAATTTTPTTTTKAMATATAAATATVNATPAAPTTSGNVPTSSSVPTASTKRFKAKVTVNATYKSAYNNISSPESQDFINTFTANVTSYLNGRLTGNINIEVKSLTNGSVVVDFDIIAPQSSNASEISIKKALKEGNEAGSLGYTLLGDITVTEVQKPSATAPTSSGNVASSSVPTASTKRFKARVTVNATYESAYNNISSQKSQDFINTFTANVTSYLNGRLSGNINIEVKKLTNGSVVVDFDIIAPQSSDATESTIKQALEDGNKTSLGYTLIGDITVTEVQNPTVTPSKSTHVTKATPAPPTSSTKGTEIWDKAIDMATPMGTFIIVVVAVALIIILLIALICVCCKYRNLKKKTHFPDHMAINDSEWIRSSDDLLMWERNLRASEVKTTNGVSNRPINDKRTA